MSRKIADGVPIATMKLTLMLLHENAGFNAPPMSSAQIAALMHGGVTGLPLLPERGKT